MTVSQVMQSLSAVRIGSQFWCRCVVLMLVLLAAVLVPSAASAQYTAPTPTACQSFTGSPFTPQQTLVDELYMVELRACVNALRVQSGLQPYNFTDTIVEKVTWIRAIHLVELRQALDEVYQARGGSHAAYYEPIVAGSTFIRAIHFNELHTFIAQVPAISCVPTLDRSSISAPWSGGVYYVNVYAPSVCYWESWRDDGLIDLTGQWDGWGNGTVTVTIYQNWNHTTHYGTLFVNGVEVAVSLAGDESDPGDDPGAPDPDDPTPPAPDEEDVEYFHTDALGSVRLITNQAGAIVSSYDYLPFGGNWPGTSNDPNAIRFAGGERDATTGFSATQALDYFGARYLDSSTGRFASVDPGHVGGAITDPQSWNGYAYARNNPLRFVDPEGTDYYWIQAQGGQLFGTDSLEPYMQGGFSFSNGNIYNSAHKQVGRYWADPFADMGRNAARMAKPGVDLAVGGLMVFGSFVAPVPMAIAGCAAGDCSAGGVAVAMLPEIAGPLKAAKILGVAKTIRAELPGGWAGAVRMFDNLPGTARSVGRVMLKEMPDGSKAVLRRFSTEGPATLEIQNIPGSKNIKFRFP